MIQRVRSPFHEPRDVDRGPQSAVPERRRVPGGYHLGQSPERAPDLSGTTALSERHSKSRGAR